MSLELKRGIICVVTARHRLAPGASLDAQLRAVVLQAGGAAAARADLFQVRENDLPDRTLLDLLGRIQKALQGSNTRLLVNDRLDVAVAAEADGVHLKETSVPIAEARRIVPGTFLVGVSAHSTAAAEEASASGGDYVIFGTIFPTRSKPPDRRLAGLDGLALAAKVCRVPLLAIGGIDAARVNDVARFAAGVAAIDWFAHTDAGRLAEAVRQARSAFDSVEPLHQN